MPSNNKPTSDKNFPKNATFDEQRNFVENLPVHTTPDNLSRVIRNVRQKESPFTITSEEIKAVDPTIELQLFHHSLGLPVSTQPDDDCDEEDGIETTAEVMRVLNISGGKKKEKITITLPDQNNGASSITLKFGSDGTFQRAYQKHIPFAAFGHGLSDENKPQVGIVAEATDQNSRRYAAFTRPKK